MFDRITVQLPMDGLLFWRLSGREALSHSFELSVQLLSTDARIERKALLGQPIVISIPTQGITSTRYLNGKITKVSVSSLELGGTRYAVYTLMMEPDLWPLKRDKNLRIFQGQTVPQIVKTLLGEYNVKLEDRLTGSYRSWEYCVQYQESSFNFISRLMELEGIYYYFRHEADGHTLVLMDAAQQHQPFSGYEAIPYHVTPSGGSTSAEGIGLWSLEDSVTPGMYSIDDYDFRKPNAWMLQARQNPASPQPGAIDVYDWPGHFVDHEHGEFYTRIRQEVWQVEHQQIGAAGTALGLAPGHTFTVLNAPFISDNGEYLTTEAYYDFEENQYASGDGAGGTKHNIAIRVIPSAVTFRAQPETPWPRTHGPQTAKVVGPKGESIWTDKYGRIKVKFHWDRLAKGDDTSSCWVRVSSAWAGQGYGGVQIPRVGDEVVVDFINGDPDRPIITGRVYNEASMPPWALPAAATQMGFMSRSKDGTPDNANALRFEDKAGAEQVWIQAERNMDTQVKNDASHSVGKNHSHYVGESELHRVETDRVHGIKGAEQLLTGKGKSDAAAEAYVIGSGTTLRLECGESAIELTASGQINIVGKGFNFCVEQDGFINTGGKLNLNDGSAAATAAPGSSHKANITRAVEALFPAKKGSKQGTAVKKSPPSSSDTESHRRGDLSMKYETGRRPGQYAQAAATVSSGRGDPGGKSYGAYQLASSAKGGHQVQKFLQNEGAKWTKEFSGMNPEKSGSFESKWKEIANSQPDEMFNAQHAFIERTHFKPALEKVLDSTGVDLSLRSAAVQDVAWSTSVQHGKAAEMLTQAVNEVKATTPVDNVNFDREFINQLYSNRTDYVNSLSKLNEKTKSGLVNRYLDEKNSAFKMLTDRI